MSRNFNIWPDMRDFVNHFCFTSERGFVIIDTILRKEQ